MISWAEGSTPLTDWRDTQEGAEYELAMIGGHAPHDSDIVLEKCHMCREWSYRYVRRVQPQVEAWGRGVERTIKRYQDCARRILALFPGDPLPLDDNAHFLIERIESILDRNLLKATS